MRSRILLTAVLAVAAAAGSARGGDRERDALLAADREFAAHTALVGITEGFLAVLTDDAHLMQAGSPTVVGRQAIEKYFEAAKSAVKEPVLAWRPEFAEVAKSGDLGYTIGVWELITEDAKGEPAKRYGKYLSVWRKDRSGRWRVAADIGNGNPPPPAAAPPVVSPSPPRPR